MLVHLLFAFADLADLLKTTIRNHQKNHYPQYSPHFLSNQEESAILQNLPKYNQDLQPKS